MQEHGWAQQIGGEIGGTAEKVSYLPAPYSKNLGLDTYEMYSISGTQFKISSADMPSDYYATFSVLLGKTVLFEEIQ